MDDLAELAVAQGRAQHNVTIDAIGPETFTYRELVDTIGKAIGRPRPIVSVPPLLGYAIRWMLGCVLRDVVVAKPEIEELMADLLYAPSAPAGTTKLSDWARDQSETLGLHYSSELGRRRDRTREYRFGA